MDQPINLALSIGGSANMISGKFHSAWFSFLTSAIVRST